MILRTGFVFVFTCTFVTGERSYSCRNVNYRAVCYIVHVHSTSKRQVIYVVAVPVVLCTAGLLYSLCVVVGTLPFK